ncbi:MAG: hypothetical protein OXN15_10290 [Chloroflexota bacterium]|nr:hypothetical protein [Chloroflexota bacterium]MDE2969039.1 hypothetical protein [Chloroflexota bacterium]
MTFNKLAGISLVLAVVVGLVAALLTPGGLLTETVDASDFIQATEVLGDNAALGQYATFIFVISVVLYWFGLSTLQRAFAGGSVMDRVSRFALNIFLVGYAFLIVELSIRHVLIHVLEHGVGGSAAEEKAIATALFAAAGGLHFAFLYVTAIGSAIFGWGLAQRCAGMSIFKLASLGLSLTGLLSFIVLIIAEHISQIDLHGVIVFSNIVLLFGSLCILVIGVGIMQDREEFVGEEAAA